MYESWPLKTSLYYCGEGLGEKISGYIIERQFELSNYFLLLANWDCSFEEGCEMIVINKSLKIVGSHSLTPFYNSYNLYDIKEVLKDRYKLTFNELGHFELVVNYPKQYFFHRVVKLAKLKKT